MPWSNITKLQWPSKQSMARWLSFFPETWDELSRCPRCMQDFHFFFCLSSGSFNYALYLCAHIFIRHYFPFLSLPIQMKRKARQHPPDNYRVRSTRWQLWSQLVLCINKLTNLYIAFRCILKLMGSQMFFCLSSSFSKSDFSNQSLSANIHHTIKLFKTKLPLLGK